MMTWLIPKHGCLFMLADLHKYKYRLIENQYKNKYELIENKYKYKNELLENKYKYKYQNTKHGWLIINDYLYQLTNTPT